MISKQRQESEEKPLDEQLELLQEKIAELIVTNEATENQLTNLTFESNDVISYLKKLVEEKDEETARVEEMLDEQMKESDRKFKIHRENYELEEKKLKEEIEKLKSEMSIMAIEQARADLSNVVLKLIEEVFDETNGYMQTYIQVVFLRIQSYLELYLTAMADFLVVEMAFCRVMAFYTTNRSNTDNSSRMLKVVLIMFLFVKTPQALLVIFNSLFLLDYYLLIAPLSTEFLKALDAANASASFIIYCVISSHFREVFVRIFVPGGIQRRIYSARTMQVTTVESTRKAAWS
ncbi:hypothetical protein GCK72_018001 [Caenorhabditis remanei]|uniref:G-protein coupled receptors family 1 profile domain-containing protein n=1 Tax=Caenorhabditis remanei TaxID=31234 RepID=A0A6A5G8Q4_CAERE|nr:hypothetical protein GCK72_018001 [Caenorhabditis remanei]KAF1751447.1 hypothetical protein GCK72_018001 [Caenorhabditis remanei]